MARLHFLTWTRLIAKRAGSVKLGLSALLEYSCFCIKTVTFSVVHQVTGRDGIIKKYSTSLAKNDPEKNLAASVGDCFSC